MILALTLTLLLNLVFSPLVIGDRNHFTCRLPVRVDTVAGGEAYVHQSEQQHMPLVGH